MRLALSVFFLCLFASPDGHAQSTLDKAAHLLEQQARTGKGEFVSFLMGAASAYRWESAEGKDARGERGFCPPPRHALDAKTYARIALDEYRRDKSQYAMLSEYPLDVLALALHRGLRARFPCADPTARAGMDAAAAQE